MFRGGRVAGGAFTNEYRPLRVALPLLRASPMKLVIEIGGEETELELADGTWRLGGGEDDAVVVPGVARGAFELKCEGERLMVSGSAAFAVDGVLSPSGVPRLLLEGERAVLAEGIFVRLCGKGLAAERPQTAMVLKELLGNLEEPEDTTSAALVCLTGLDVGRRFPLAGELLEVGRGETVAVRVRDRAVSRRHAVLRRTEGGGHTVEDLGAPNGLYVNGSRVSGAVPLADGAVLELGHSLLRYRAAPKEPEPVPLGPGDAEPGAEVAAAGSDEAGADPGTEVQSPEEVPIVDPAGKRWSRRVRVRVEHALVAVGVLIAVLGAVVTWNFVSG